MNDSELKRTPLYSLQKRLGARFTEFGGWEMPVQFSGLTDEHQTVRSAVGFFDVSHMGEIIVSGKDSEEWLDYMTCNCVSSLAVGKAQYSMLLNENGGVVDDIIIYKLEDSTFFLCVNAANTAKDYSWLLEHTRGDVEVRDVSAEYAQIAIQGPKAAALLAALSGYSEQGTSLESFPAFTFTNMEIVEGNSKISVLCARTGYTGEDGFELFCPPAHAESLANRILEIGQSFGIKPAGLGARDTLRLEACYPLHGHEISDEISPLEAGLAWVVKLDKTDFLGKKALLRQKELGIPRKLVGLEVLVPGIIREGAPIFEGEEQIGFVTSGTKPPTVNKAIALAIMDAQHASVGKEFEAEVRNRKLAVRVIQKPFYRRSDS